nr:hypothetical protein [uncultured Albidiferax sp.]
MQILRLLALFSAVTAYGSAFSQTPISVDKKTSPAQPAQRKITTQILSDAQPDVMKAIQPEPSESKVRKNRYENDEKPEIEWRTFQIAFSSAIIALLALMISLYQSLMFRKQLNLMKTALDDATNSAQTTNKMNRPYVFFHETIKTPIKPRKENPEELVQPIKDIDRLLGFNFRNVGSSPAFIESIKWQIFYQKHPPCIADITQNGSLPKKATSEARIMPRDQVLPNNESWPRNHRIPVELTAEMKENSDPEKKIYLCGYITYVDPFSTQGVSNVIHKTTFCRFWDGWNFVSGNLYQKNFNHYE